MGNPYVLGLLGAATVGFALVRWSPISAALAAGLGLLAGVGYVTFTAFFSEPSALGAEIDLAIGAVFITTLFIAWLVGVGAAAVVRRRASAPS
jgi:hypothetical protein